MSDCRRLLVVALVAVMVREKKLVKPSSRGVKNSSLSRKLEVSRDSHSFIVL